MSPTGVSRGISYLWGDTVRTWGDSTATWGYAYVPTNISKSSVGTTITVGSPIGLLLALTYSTTTSSGGWTNQTKN